GQALLLRETAGLVPKGIPPNQMFWAFLTTIAFALAAVAIILNRAARPAMLMMALLPGLFGVLAWVPHVVAHPQAHFHWFEYVLTFLTAGAAWMVADSGSR